MEQAITLDPEYAPAYAALGAVQLAGGRSEKAKESFEKAVQLDPKSVAPRLALANYDWAVGDHAAAERELKAALASEPDNMLAHRAMALFYLSDRRAPEAEPHFKALAADSPDGTLALADFYTGLGRRDEALAVLNGITDKKAQREAQAAHCDDPVRERKDGRRASAHRCADQREAAKPRRAHPEGAAAAREPRRSGRGRTSGAGGGPRRHRVDGRAVHRRARRHCAEGLRGGRARVPRKREVEPARRGAATAACPPAARAR